MFQPFSLDLHRPQRKRLLAGVCAGIADSTHYPLDHIRFFFILLTLIGGLGLPIYLTLWLLVPEK